jgi:hypothetical protein
MSEYAKVLRLKSPCIWRTLYLLSSIMSNLGGKLVWKLISRGSRAVLALEVTI